jgi:PAS domain-containing protein
MAKLPRIGRSLLSGRPRLLLPSNVRGRIIAGFVLLTVVLAAVVLTSAWQDRQHRSALDEMESSADIHHLLDQATQNATLANLLLERYLVTENDAVVPAIRSSMAVVADSLTEARSQEVMRGDQSAIDVDDEAEVERLDDLITSTATISETFEQVIALQLSGDAEGARQTLEAAAPELTVFGIEVAEAAEEERDEIPILQSSANRTADQAFWLLVVSGVIGGTLGLAISVLIARSVLRPLSGLQAAALAVAGGDLETRVEPTGPRELASLGRALNQMADSLLDASKRRELEAERERVLAQLQESEERLHRLLDSSPTVIYSSEPEGDYAATYISENVTSQSGYEAREFTEDPRFWAGRIHPEDAPRVFAEVPRVPGVPTVPFSDVPPVGE